MYAFALANKLNNLLKFFANPRYTTLLKPNTKQKDTSQILRFNTQVLKFFLNEATDKPDIEDAKTNQSLRGEGFVYSSGNVLRSY